MMGGLSVGDVYSLILWFQFELGEGLVSLQRVNKRLQGLALHIVELAVQLQSGQRPGHTINTRNTPHTTLQHTG